MKQREYINNLWNKLIVNRYNFTNIIAIFKSSRDKKKNYSARKWPGLKKIRGLKRKEKKKNHKYVNSYTIVTQLVTRGNIMHVVERMIKRDNGRHSIRGIVVTLTLEKCIPEARMKCSVCVHSWMQADTGVHPQ